MEDPSEQSESGSDSAKQDNSDNYDSEKNEPPEESEEPSDTAQNVPAAVRKLYHSFAGKRDPSAQSRTGSGSSLDHENSSIVFYGATYYCTYPPRLMHEARNTTDGFDQPTESVRQLGPEASTMREA